MSGIGGGLHDDDRPPYEAVAAEVHGKWREWAFWLSMALGLWSSYQGMPIVAFWFTIILIAFPALAFVLTIGVKEYRT